MKKLNLLLLICFTFEILSAQSYIFNKELWRVNSSSIGPAKIYDVLKDEASNTIYIAGDFDDTFSPGIGAVWYDSTTRKKINFPTIEGSQVFAAIPDNDNGWIISGSFVKVDNQVRNGLAQLDAYGNLTDLKIDPNGGLINNLILKDSLLYLGGNFSSINGQARTCLAVLNMNTGNLLSWAPVITGVGLNRGTGLYEMKIEGNILYTCGVFTHVNAVPRKYFASFNLNQNSLDSLKVNANSYINTIDIVSGQGTIYLGGDFGQINGLIRNGLAAVDALTGAISTWKPMPLNGNGSNNPQIQSIVHSDSVLYVCGTFSKIGVGQVDMDNIASFDLNSGNLKSWVPKYPSGFWPAMMSKLHLSGNTLYTLGTWKTSHNLENHNVNFAAIDLGSDSIEWHLNTSSLPTCIAAQKGTVLLGLKEIDYRHRLNVMALDAATGIPTGWNPQTDGPVYTIKKIDNDIYLGGDFSSVRGVARENFAIVDADSGFVANSNFNVNGPVFDIEAQENRVFVAGDFTIVNGQSKSHLFEMDRVNLTLSGFNIGSDDAIRTLVIVDSSMYLGGDFTTVGGQLRSKLGEIDLSSNLTSNWIANVESTGSVFALEVTDSTLFVGGNFNQISGTNKPDLASISRRTGSVNAWNPNMIHPSNSQSIVKALELNNDILHVGGKFNLTGSQNSSSFMSIHAQTASILWHPQQEFNFASINAIYENGELYAGGTQGYYRIPTDSTTYFGWRMVCRIFVGFNCNTTSLIDSIENCGPYTWRNGETYFVSNSSTTYLQSNPDGCDTMYNLKLLIKPEINTTIQVFGDSLISLENNALYQWLKCDIGFSKIIGANNSSFVPLDSGYYSVEI